MTSALSNTSLSSSVPIILASTSPRRHELLNQVNIPHTILKVETDETQHSSETPITYIERMVSQKALATLDSTELQSLLHYGDKALIITADTIGVLPSNHVLQKPKNYQDVVAMWQQMSGKAHQVWTAVQVSLVEKNDTIKLLQSHKITVKTEVTFVELNDNMMAEYWVTGEPHDKAGGYGIQGQGGAWVKSIHGSYSNVVGLPLAETIELLSKMATSINSL